MSNQQQSSLSPSQLDHYKKIKQIGADSFSNIFLYERISDHLLVCLQFINIKGYENFQSSNLEGEVDTLKNLDHPHIIKYFEHFRHEDNFVIVKEYVDGKTLREIINEQLTKNELFPEEFIYQIFFQIVSALSHCHALNLVHSDLKSEHILITKENLVKLIDFGISNQIETILRRMVIQAGTSVYTSPEIVNEEKYTSSTDIWSLGCIIYELISLTPPFTYNLNEYSKSIAKKEIPNFESLKCSKQLNDLIQQMFCYVPNSRISISDIENSPFLLQFEQNIQNIPSENESDKRENVKNPTISEQEKLQQNVSKSDSIQTIPLKTLTFSDETKRIISKWKNISFKCEYLKDENSNQYQIIPHEQTILISPLITGLGDFCFFFYSSLTSINLPSSLQSLGNSCFSGCSSLTSINLPSSLQSLGDKCFSNCSSLISINLPSSLQSIGDECFSWCSSLTSVNLPSSLQSLGKECFSECSSLSSINLPSSLQSLGKNCFY
jgi:serine/threonine protein kinase